MIRSNLAVLLAERNLKIADVWRKTGISRTTLHGLFHNTSNGIQWDTLDKLCKFLNVLPGDLIQYHDLFFTIDRVIKTDDQWCTMYVTWRTGGKEAQYRVVVNLSSEYYHERLMELSMVILLPPDLDGAVREIPILFRTGLEDALITAVVNAYDLDLEGVLFSVNWDTYEDEDTD